LTVDRRTAATISHASIIVSFIFVNVVNVTSENKIFRNRMDSWTLMKSCGILAFYLRMINVMVETIVTYKMVVPRTTIRFKYMLLAGSRWNNLMLQVKKCCTWV
jgi:hypothetical protein